MSYYSSTNSTAFRVTSDGSVVVGDSPVVTSADASKQNTSIGYYSGSALTSGVGNTTIGYDAQVSATTGGATVIGASTKLLVANATTTSIVIGEGASSTNNNVCVIGAQTDSITVVEYGPHFGYYDNPLKWQDGAGGYDGSSFTITASQLLSGLLTFYSLDITPAPTHTCTTASAAQVVAAIPDCRVGSAWYFKIGVYASVTTACNLTMTFGAGWTTRGKTGAQRIPAITTKTDGSVTYLCIVTAVPPSAAAITVICPSGPTA